MKLKRKLPEGRTFDQLRNHYEVEKSLALRLKNTTREQRKALYPLLYEELFQKVPDHPRLAAREKAKQAQEDNLIRRKFELVRKFIDRAAVFVEFGPGDCRFSAFMARHVKCVLAVDISDQRSPRFEAPDNFKFIPYDGYALDIKESAADIVFSDQLIEHLHPEDMELHFALVRKILREGGVYVFRTPHAFFGPHDISGYFSDEPEGFHLKEWTFSEIAGILERLNYSHWDAWMRRKNTYKRIPYGYFQIVETMLKNRPRRPRRLLSRLFLSLKMVVSAVK
ncbi:MAG: class I SAM-dependent methyltransferase [Candidatus Aminicenantales bacterium]